MKPRIVAVVPCYCVRDAVAAVVEAALAHCDQVICVDDACPEHSGKTLDQAFDDPAVRVIFHAENRGVGGALETGYRAALEAGADVVVKLDGDGQMDPSLIPELVQPILDGDSDYCKGSRFHELAYLRGMPLLRLFGNSVLSFMTKLSSGYWQTMDPTNGFTAIGRAALKTVPLDKVSDGYFFESDMLFRLNISRAVVTDIPMKARYEDETSSLKISRVIGPFLLGNTRNFFKRIFYNYFLRDFNVASLQLLTGVLISIFSLVTGISAWSESISSGVTASSGTVMLAGLTAIFGFHLLLSFLHFDIQNVPKRALGSFRRRGRST